MTLQTIFPDSAVLRLLNRNLTGACIFAFRSDQASVKKLGHKYFPTNIKWFMSAYTHAISCTKNGYIYVDTGNDTQLKEKYTVRNFIAPIFFGKKILSNLPPTSQKEGSADDRSYLNESIRAIAKKGHQYIYADPREKATY